MQAVNDRILVKKGIVPERTIGGILVAANTSVDAKVKLNIGRVISCGAGLRFHDGYYVKPDCEPGDHIMWEQYGDLAAEVLGDDIVCVRWEDVICKLDAKEVEGWFFDRKEYDKYREELDSQIAKAKEEQRAREAEAASKRIIRVCQNKNCHQIGRPVENKELCEYCGNVMSAVEDRKGPSIFVRGGASPGRV